MAGKAMEALRLAVWITGFGLGCIQLGACSHYTGPVTNADNLSGSDQR